MVNGVLQFKITILGIAPPIWRQILVPEEFTFYEFHVAIQDAMGWKHRQPYVFHKLSNAPGLQIYRPQPVGQFPLSIIDYRIRDFLKQHNDWVLYEYDSFRHLIELEWNHRRTEVPRPLMCVGGERACPPDGLGGVQNYQGHLVIVSNPNNIEHAIYMAWLVSVGGPLNPEYFDHQSVVFSDAQTRFLYLQTP